MATTIALGTASTWWRGVLVVCLATFLGVQPATGAESVDLHAQRVEAIKQCAHGADQICPHGRVWHVNNRAPNAADDNDGSEAAPFQTIDRAAQAALPGDTVLVSKGVYREHVAPKHSGYDVAHMITYKAKHRRQVVIKGSEVWNPEWTKTPIEGLDASFWKADLDPALFNYDFPVKEFNPFHQGDQLVTMKPETLYDPIRPVDPAEFPPPVRGMIFVNGQRIRQARSMADFVAGSDVFFVPPDGKSIYARFAHDDPMVDTFEITTREQVFAPRTTGVGFIHVKGFVMEHGATAPAWIQYGMVSPGSVLNDPAWHWIIEDNAIRLSNACGLDIGMGYWGPARSSTRGSISEEIGDRPRWDHWVIGNEITDHGQAGIWSIGGSNNSIIEYNRIERNGWQNNIHMVEAAGLKMHGAEGVVIRGNLVRDNDNFGIWLDITGANNRVTQNLLLNNMTAGVFIEGTWGHTLVDNNIAAFTRAFAFYQMNMGDGFYSHQAAHVTFAHNLAFANTGYGYRALLWGKGGSRQFPDSQMRVSHNRVLNNIAYANGRGAICLPLDQEICRDNLSDYNFAWGPSALPLFELGRGVLPPSEMMATVEAAMAKAGVGADQVPFLAQWKSGQMGPNVGDMRHYGPLVSLPVWQAAQGRDLHSVVGPLPLLWLTEAGQMQIDLNIPEEPRGKCPGDGEEVSGATPGNYHRLDEVKCQPIAEIVCDYFGNRRPKDETHTVGPFQELGELGQDQKQEVFLHLWPLDRSRQLPAASLRLSRPRPELDEQEKASGETY